MRASNTLKSADVLAGAIAALQVMQDTSTIVPVVPCLAVTISSVLRLLKLVQKARSCREQFVRLAQRASDLLVHIEASICRGHDAIDTTLKINLAALQDTLARIQGDVEKQLRKSFLKCVFQVSSVSAKLDRHLETLDCAWRSFDTACLIAIQNKIHRQSTTLDAQALWDQNQLRLFRPSEIRLCKVRGAWILGSKNFGEEWEGEWAGRAVVVRVTRKKFDVSELTAVQQKGFHPHVAQLLGYSHPSVTERFYVLERGQISIMSRFQRTEASVMDRLGYWMQFIFDFQKAFYYLALSGFPVGDAVGNAHRHSHGCLPSACLTEDGKLLVEAQDFCAANAGCLRSWLRTMHDGMHEIPWTPVDLAPEANVLKNPLIAPDNTRVTAVGLKGYRAFMVKQPVELWATYASDTLPGDCLPGDFGYLDRQNGSRFVRLGSVWETLEGDHKDRSPASAESVDMTACQQRYDVTCLEADSAIVEKFSHEATEFVKFFWLHAVDIARTAGIALHDITFVCERRRAIPSNHASGDVGHSVRDGTDAVGIVHRYARLPAFEAEFLQYVADNTRDEDAVLDHKPLSVSRDVVTTSLEATRTARYDDDDTDSDITAVDEFESCSILSDSDAATLVDRQEDI